MNILHLCMTAARKKCNNHFKISVSGKNTMLLFCCLIPGVSAFTQYSERKFSKKQQEYTDSLKKVNYNHVFPLLGKKAYKLGFDIPYPAGIMTNYFYATQGLIIEDLQLSLQSNNQDIPFTDVDFIEFGTNTTTASSYNVRPDLWILPFLDLYGVFGVGTSTTTVCIVSPVELRSQVKQNIKTAGFGFTTAFGLGPLFVAIDNNWTWNKPEKLDKSVPATVLSLRLGHTIKFKNYPNRNIGIWAGAMRARIGAGTLGQIKLSEALPPDVWNKKDELVQNYYEWYDGLNSSNPADRIKQAAADKILTPIFERIDAADGSATIGYAMSKRPAAEWNMIIGGQFQLNKRWAFRSEGGIVGNRKSFLLSANYRFLVF